MLAEQQSVRAYPRPYGVNLAHVLGYLSPITEDEFDQAKEDGDRSVNGASSVGPRRRREGVRHLAARDARLQAGGRRLHGPGARRRQRGPGPARRHARHLDRRQGPGGRGEAARRDDQARAPDPRHGHRSQLRGRLGRRGRAGGEHRPGRRDGQPADVRPLGLGGRHHEEPARPPLLREGRHPAAGPRHAGAVRPGLDLEAVHDRGRAHQRLLPGHPAQLLVVVPGRATATSRTTSPAPTAPSASPRRSRSRATPSSTGSATTSGSASAPTSPTSTPGTRSSRRPRSSASAARPASTSRARPRAGSRTGSGSWPTTSRRRTTTAALAAQAPGRGHQRLRLQVRPRVLHRGLRLPCR